jgi:glutaconate CoA-transferase subunit B
MGTKATPYEVMAAAISHELNDSEKWFIGLSTGETTILLLSRIPIAGMALAQYTHAPNSSILVAGWIVNPTVSEIPTGMESEFGTVLRDWRCECLGNSLYSPYSADRGEMDVGFGSAAQIDKYGNCNIVCIGDYYKPKVRLIGPINQPGHFALFGREFIVCDHEKRNFVDRVDFISGVGYLDGPGAREKLGLIGGGPCLIFTNKAVFDFDPETKLARLKSIHPGESLGDVIDNTGFTHDYVPQHVPETPPPTDEELRLLREVIDPRGVLLPRE